MIVAQDRAFLEHHVRDSDTSWTPTEVQSLDATLNLPSIGCSIPMREIYVKVDLPERTVAR